MTQTEFDDRNKKAAKGFARKGDISDLNKMTDDLNNRQMNELMSATAGTQFTGKSGNTYTAADGGATMSSNESANIYNPVSKIGE